MSVIKFSIFFLIAGLTFISCKKETMPSKTTQPPVEPSGKAAMLLHVFNHSTYHPGQLVNMLQQLGVEKITVDGFYCVEQEEVKIKLN